MQVPGKYIVMEKLLGYPQKLSKRIFSVKIGSAIKNISMEDTYILAPKNGNSGNFFVNHFNVMSSVVTFLVF
jgi:hypothetical protein